MDAEPGFPQVFSGLGVAMIDYQDIQKVFVRLSHTGDGNGQALCRHQNIRGSRHRLGANNGADGGDRGVGLLQCVHDAGNGEDGANTGDGIAGSEEHHGGRQNGVSHARSGFRFLGSGEANGIHRILIPALHEIFLEAQISGRRVDPGFHAGVAHGKDPGLYAHPGSDGRGNFSQSFAFLQ